VDRVHAKAGSHEGVCHMNPAAGKEGPWPPYARALGRHFAASHIDYEVHETLKTDKPGEIVRTRCTMASISRWRRGGRNGLGRHRRSGGYATPLGIIPTGTGNLIARELGIPDDIDDAVAVVASAPAREPLTR